MLDDALSRLVTTVEGARAAILLGMDGVVVAGAGDSDGLSFELLAAAWAGVQRKVLEANTEAGLGSPVELVMSCGSSILVLRLVTPEYGLLVVLDPRGSLGRARFELRKAAGRILPELRS